MTMPNYHIKETEIGPIISHSRVSVYDVLQACNDGHSLLEICTLLNLRPVQVQIALEHIETNKSILESELAVIKQIALKRNTHHRLIAEKIQRKIDTKPMTPKRKQLQAIRQSVLMGAV